METKKKEKQTLQNNKITEIVLKICIYMIKEHKTEFGSMFSFENLDKIRMV